MLCSVSLFARPAMASHLLGGEFYYQLIDSSGGIYHYRATLTTYADCINGQPEALSMDNPAFFSLYEGTTCIQVDTSIYFSSSATVPVTLYCVCASGPSPLGVLRKTFVKDYHLPRSSTGYTIVYQRAGRNAALSNVIDPGDVGVTFYCSIPPSGTARINNSAVFAHATPQEVCINHPFVVDNSATDADGDSLSYELCTAYEGASPSNIKPIPLPPPYTSVPYQPPYTFSSPMSCSVPLHIDAATGMLTGTPNLLGRYLVAVCCKEWRGGVIINTVRREYELAVTSGATLSPYHPFAGNDTSILVGESVNFNASMGTSYAWTPGTYLSDSTIANPVGTYPTAGTFTYVLHAVSDSGCTGSDTVTVNVLETSMIMMPNAFTPNGDGLNDRAIPLQIANVTLTSFKILNRDGKEVFVTSDIKLGWDGTYNGTKQPAGNYLWEIVFKDNQGQTRRKTGNITIVR
jgi:gliding motility-associated-like protein